AGKHPREFFMSIGTELIQAREKAGLTRDQVAARIKVPVFSIEALESSDFASLPTGTYLGDIVRDYASAVGADPEPLIERAQSEQQVVANKWNVSLGDLDDFLQTELGNVSHAANDDSFRDPELPPPLPIPPPPPVRPHKVVAAVR